MKKKTEQFVTMDPPTQKKRDERRHQCEFNKNKIE